MTAIQLLACAGMIAGAFLILGIRPVEFTDSLFAWLLKPKRSIREEIKESSGRKKAGILRREISEAQSVLEMTGRGEPLLYDLRHIPGAVLPGRIPGNSAWEFLSGSGHGSGVSVPAVLVCEANGQPLQEGCIGGTGNRPFCHHDRLSSDRGYRDGRRRKHRVFKSSGVKGVSEFLTQIKLVNPNVEAALRGMRGRIDNEVFREWCDALSDCQHDRSLKTTLTPIVAKLSDMRNVNAELEYLIAEPRKEFLIMVIFVIGNIPLMYMLNKDWYDVLMHTPLGQIILSVTAAVIFVSAGCVVKLTRPIEYRR